MFTAKAISPLLQALLAAEHDLLEGHDVAVYGIGAVVGLAHDILDGLALEEELLDDLLLVRHAGADVVDGSAA